MANFFLFFPKKNLGNNLYHENLGLNLTVAPKSVFPILKKENLVSVDVVASPPDKIRTIDNLSIDIDDLDEQIQKQEKLLAEISDFLPRESIEDVVPIQQLANKNQAKDLPKAIDGIPSKENTFILQTGPNFALSSEKNDVSQFASFGLKDYGTEERFSSQEFVVQENFRRGRPKQSFKLHSDSDSVEDYPDVDDYFDSGEIDSSFKRGKPGSPFQLSSSSGSFPQENSPKTGHRGIQEHSHKKIENLNSASPVIFLRNQQPAFIKSPFESHIVPPKLEGFQPIIEQSEEAFQKPSFENSVNIAGQHDFLSPTKTVNFPDESLNTKLFQTTETPVGLILTHDDYDSNISEHSFHGHSFELDKSSGEHRGQNLAKSFKDFTDSKVNLSDFQLPERVLTGNRIEKQLKPSMFHSQSLNRGPAFNNKTATFIFVLLSSLTNSGKFGNLSSPHQTHQINLPDENTKISFHEGKMLNFHQNPEMNTTFPKQLQGPTSCKVTSESPKCLVDSEDFCLEDETYPASEINLLTLNDALLVHKYAEVTDPRSKELVPFLVGESDENYDYSYFHPSTYDNTHWFGPEGYICPSKVLHQRPLLAKNAKGVWKYIVNDGSFFTQTLRMEICLFPNTPCRLIAPCFRSRCLQKYNYRRLLAYDPCDGSKGLHTDIFKLPTACSCYAPAFYGEQGFGPPSNGQSLP